MQPLHEDATHPLEPLLDPPELLEPPCVMQSDPTHAVPAPQTWHALPADPHALLSDVPTWQVPVESQHPEHDDWQLPPLLLELLLPPPESSPGGIEESSPVGEVPSSPPDDDDVPAPLLDPVEDP